MRKRMVHENLPMEMSPEWKAITKCESRIEALEKTLERHGEMLVEDEDRYDKLESVLKELGEKLIRWQYEQQTNYDKKCFATSLRNTLNKLSGEKDPYEKAQKDLENEIAQWDDDSKPESDILYEPIKSDALDALLHALPDEFKLSWWKKQLSIFVPNHIIISREDFDKLMDLAHDYDFQFYCKLKKEASGGDVISLKEAQENLKGYVAKCKQEEKEFNEQRDEKAPEPKKKHYNFNYIEDRVRFEHDIEERVRGATRKELIAEFIQKLKDLPIHHYKRPMAYVSDISNLIDEYEAKDYWRRYYETRRTTKNI